MMAIVAGPVAAPAAAPRKRKAMSDPALHESAATPARAMEIPQPHK
jgi:hypothetical protein